jgi:hypothetical protein
VDEQATVPASHQDLVERPLITHFAIVRADGSPQSNPMWFIWDGSRFRGGGPVRDADVRVVLVIRPTVILARSFKPGDPEATIQRSVAAHPA